MKRLISLILISVTLLLLVGCNDNTDNTTFDTFESTVFRVGWTHGGAFFENALNAEKLSNKSSFMPIYRADTKEELENFKSTYNDRLYIEGNDDGKLAKYDEEFFKENSLLIVYVESGSGSIHFGFDSLTLSEDSVCVHIVCTNNPAFGTDDMAGWIITVAVPDSIIKSCTSFDAVYDGYKGDETTAETTTDASEPEELTPRQRTFRGRLLEHIDGNSYIMEVTDVGTGNFYEGEKVIISSSMLSHFQIRDILEITFDGKVTMSLPPLVANIFTITLIRSERETSAVSVTEVP